MPADSIARKPNQINKGRPFGSVTRFPGSVLFCRENDVTHSHLYRVLMGERQSRSLIAKYSAWLKAHKLTWPAAAKVKPAA